MPPASRAEIRGRPSPSTSAAQARKTTSRAATATLGMMRRRTSETADQSRITLATAARTTAGRLFGNMGLRIGPGLAFANQFEVRGGEVVVFALALDRLPQQILGPGVVAADQ